VNITNTAYICQSPKVAIDSSDVIHVVFIADLGNQEGIYMNSTSWATTTNVTNTADPSYPADIAVDSTGTVHILWKEIDPGGNNYWYANSTNWGSSVNISDSATDVNFGKLCVDSTDTVHVVYCDEISGQYKLFYTDSLDWVANRTMLYQELGASTWCDITADSQDRLHFSWTQEGTDGLNRVLYFNSDSYSGDPVVVSDPFVGTSYTYVAVGPDGSVHICWEANFGGKGSLWRARILPGGQVLRDRINEYDVDLWMCFPHMAVDSVGDVHLVWRRETDITFHYYQLFYVNSGK
jgi:hypothetical protein